jgi:hypothetical protein
MTVNNVWIGSQVYWTLKQFVTTDNYDILSYTPHTTAHKTFLSSLAVPWQRLPLADVSLFLCSWTDPGLSYQLLITTVCRLFLDWLVVRVRVRVSFATGGLPPISSSSRQAPWDSRPVVVLQLNTCGYSPYVTSSLTRDEFVSSPAQSFSGPGPAELMTKF